MNILSGKHQETMTEITENWIGFEADPSDSKLPDFWPSLIAGLPSETGSYIKFGRNVVIWTHIKHRSKSSLQCCHQTLAP